MERFGLRYWLLIFLLVLTLTGAITLGDIFRFICGAVGVLVLMVLVFNIVLRVRINRARREAEARGEEFGGYTWHFGSHSHTYGGGQQQQSRNNPNEGRVRVSRTEAPKKKKVSKNVGEYVDFEEE
ncbi:MAG: DUF4834 family protein [Tidjanibacter sp.]|nr:DUF4834 family protein [Tidjanibacter sp.]